MASRKRNWLKNITINVIVFVSIIALVETIYGALYSERAKLNQVYVEAGRQTEQVYVDNIKLDEYGRRITSPENANVLGINSHNKHLIFFGCSFTFGTFIFNEDSLPYITQQKVQNYSVYNYGQKGKTTSNMLDILIHRDLQQEVPEHDGIAIYVFIEDHLRRNVGDLTVMEYPEWGDELPYFDLDQNQNVVEKGTFKDRHPLSDAYKLLSKSNFIRYYNINLGPSDDYKVKLTSKMIAEASHLYKEKFNGEFYVLFHPQSPVTANTLALQEQLKQGGIPYITADDLAATLNADPQKYLAEDNEHPSGQANQLISDFLVNYLQLN